MAVTCCVLRFTKELGRLPLERHRWRESLLALPKECPATGQCSPGGCRKHCTDYATGEWLRRSNEPKNNRPPKAKAKGKKR